MPRILRQTLTEGVPKPDPADPEPDRTERFLLTGTLDGSTRWKWQQQRDDVLWLRKFAESVRDEFRRARERRRFYRYWTPEAPQAPSPEAPENGVPS